jgi:MFS family permease
MLQSAALAVLVLGKWITIPEVIGLALFQGFVDAIDTPARQAFVVEMVDDPVDLANAIALNSSIFNTARCVGPALAGILLYFNVSPGWCFAGDSASYIAVIVGLLMMRLKLRQLHTQTAGALEAFKSGVRYTFGFPPLRSILFLVGISSFTAAGLSTLMPLFADAMLTGPHGAARYGLLMALTGVGAFTGAMYLAQRKTVVGLARVMCLASLLMGMGMSLFVLTHDFYIGGALCMFVGFGMVTHFASGNTLLQSITEDAMRGRVMSFFAMFVIGMSPFGALLAGWLSKPLSPRLVVVFYSLVGILAAVWFLRQLPKLRPLIRPIYVKKGIIPEVAVALAMEEREER